MIANGENMLVRYTLDPKNPRRLTAAELKRLDETPIDYSDIPELDDEWFERARLERSLVKKQLTIRLDSDVLDWVKRHGRGYQTRINRILRMVMESQPPSPKGPSKPTAKRRSPARPKARVTRRSAKR
jgi:uncharacterized protein (DUF4415 family)